MTVPRNHLARRQVLKVLGTGAAASLLACDDGVEPPTPSQVAGTPTDPDLIQPVVDWELLLTAEEMVTVAALCDVIIPADDRSPSASAVGAPDFINEWVSAPYPSQENDRIVIRGGLVWLNTEATERFEAPFADLPDDQKQLICDDIKFVQTATPEFAAGARFFRLFRNLTSTAFYTTREGMDDLGYVGNQALPSFPGPPAEVLRHLGLA